jgi:transcriptional regulator with XRE-family HTH domain
VGFAEERDMAEQALAAYDLETVEERAFPPVAQRILRAREAAGLTHVDVAARWGEPVSMYWDLEFHDDEAFTVVSVKQLQRLAVVLGTTVTTLLFGEDPSELPAAAGYSEIVARLRARLAEEPVSVEVLSDRIGWELEPLFADPGALGDLPICAMRSVCHAAGIDWVAPLST